MSPVLRGPVLERVAAVRAVDADALLVPRPVVLVLQHGELVRRLRSGPSSLDRGAAVLPAARPARVEGDDEAVLVLVDLHVAVALRADEVAAHRLEREVEVAEERVVVRPLADVERAV